jgi:hypothetical protein
MLVLTLLGLHIKMGLPLFLVYWKTKCKVATLFYAGSTMVCVPASLSQNGPALGAQTGEAVISQVVKAGGFKHFRRATQTPFNIVYEAKLG